MLQGATQTRYSFPFTTLNPWAFQTKPDPLMGRTAMTDKTIDLDQPLAARWLRSPRIAVDCRRGAG